MTKRPLHPLAPAISKACEGRPGRASTYAPRTARKVLQRLAAGQSLRAICREPGMPSEGTVRGWANTVPAFTSQYARARDCGIDAHADELLEIADIGSGDVRRDRLRSDNRKWLLSKLFPKKFGNCAHHGGAVPDTVSGMEISALRSRLHILLCRGKGE